MNDSNYFILMFTLVIVMSFGNYFESVIMFNVSDLVKSITEDQLTALPIRENYDEAVQLCKDHGLNLIRINDAKTNVNFKFIFIVFSSYV